MFIPRHSVVENQFCSYAENASFGAAGVGGVIAYAGSVVYLDPDATNQEAMVKKMAHSVSETPFGFLMQKVKAGYHSVHPTGFVMPGDLGSSDAISQPVYDNTGAIVGTKSVPVGVAHLGIFDTVHYTSLNGVAAIAPGESLRAAADEARVTTSVGSSDGSTDKVTGAAISGTSGTVVARVVKGASAAKATANIANTTLYPIRIKLLV